MVAVSAAHRAPIAPRLLTWYQISGREHLPWRRNITPFRVWVSETMLQQTRVETVVPYFERFMAAFSSLEALAGATEDQVLHLWTGLGYYSRARNLHRAAGELVAAGVRELPHSLDGLMALPGIGRSTAGAILSIACGVRAPILDGNAKRVLARYHAIPGWPGRSATARALWSAAEQETPENRFDEYTQAMMDLGAAVCVRGNPRCADCPIAVDCAAHQSGQADQFPAPRPRRVVPQVEVHWAVIRDARGAVLLEQRPQPGIWGGLWTFPQAASSDALQDALGATQGELRQLGRFSHLLTHRRLDIHVHRLCLADENSLARLDGQMGGRWYDPLSPPAVGLPAAMRRVLDQLQPRD
ncbi:MAG: A/G-specific adenine glycosylase [Pseudomonadota bacterium]|nr:A/G-specific adenine glycosylase [Pseudomonadota bacterium]